MDVLFTEKLPDQQGFNITFNALDEYSNEDCFCAEIIISCRDITLSSNYLGGCHGEYRDFIESDGHG